MNDQLLASLKYSMSIVMRVLIYVMILISLILVGEVIIAMFGWKTIVINEHGYFSYGWFTVAVSIHSISLVVAIIIFIIGWFVRKRIRRTEGLKSKFITVAAHSLRTPLTRIQWGLEELYENESNEDTRAKIRLIEDTIEDTTGLVNYLLDATEAENVSVYYDYIFENGSIEHIVRNIIADYSVGIKKKDIQLNVSIDDTLPKILMDKERIRIVMSALVENAVIYTPKSGTIDIAIYRKNDSIIFSITDTGIGITKESLSDIFSKFFRTRDAVSISADHIGLALFISREIIKRHNGDIHVESKGRAQGSQFWFSLPIA